MDEFLLVLDGFSGHRDHKDGLQQISNTFRRKNIHVLTSPSGCTPLLQPLDVSINKAFKLPLKRYWTQWISDQILFVQPDKLRSPGKDQIVTWVENAWYETPVEVVKNAFLCTGISNFSQFPTVNIV